MVTDNDEALSTSQYWDSRYARSDGQSPTHEWFLSFSQLRQFFYQNLFQVRGTRPTNNPLLLHLGSGDSDIPKELASQGYRRQLCVDFSPVVVNTMTERHSNLEGIEWKQMDVRDMSDIIEKSVDVAFNKGTLDAMIHGSPWNPPDEVKQNTSQYINEVFRVLKDDGVFLYITFRQPHFIRPLLNPDQQWDLDMQVLGEGGSIPYFAFVLKKRQCQFHQTRPGSAEFNRNPRIIRPARVFRRSETPVPDGQISDRSLHQPNNLPQHADALFLVVLHLFLMLNTSRQCNQPRSSAPQISEYSIPPT